MQMRFSDKSCNSKPEGPYSLVSREEETFKAYSLVSREEETFKVQ